MNFFRCWFTVLWIFWKWEKCETTVYPKEIGDRQWRVCNSQWKLWIYFYSTFWRPQLNIWIYFADMFGLEMVTSLSEIQRNELVCWRMRKSDGACTMSGCGWLKRRSTASFSQDLGNATKMTENVPMFMTLQKLQSAPNFWMDYVPMQIANWLTRFPTKSLLHNCA